MVFQVAFLLAFVMAQVPMTRWHKPPTVMDASTQVPTDLATTHTVTVTSVETSTVTIREEPCVQTNTMNLLLASSTVEMSGIQTATVTGNQTMAVSSYHTDVVSGTETFPHTRKDSDVEASDMFLLPTTSTIERPGNQATLATTPTLEKTLPNFPYLLYLEMLSFQIAQWMTPTLLISGDHVTGSITNSMNGIMTITTIYTSRKPTTLHHELWEHLWKSLNKLYPDCPLSGYACSISGVGGFFEVWSWRINLRVRSGAIRTDRIPETLSCDSGTAKQARGMARTDGYHNRSGEGICRVQGGQKRLLYPDSDIRPPYGEDRPS